MSYDHPRVQVLLDDAGVRVVVLSGEFDVDSVEPVRGVLAAAVRDGVRVVVDISAVTFADSSLLTTLLFGRRSAPLALAGPVPSQFAELLEMSCAGPSLEIEPTREGARARAAALSPLERLAP
ncbi:STAS domain-containing protein [Streptomyces sp. G-G2]|uniref:STAS domain-containing protein n=1 Tax=Streptomyces sp. G-G2 TaxID=3046201 RepID=UPI0024B9C5DE|nr:STAS domain-containing protein [Streptomyces sp. G-G2]MDJ0384793.1 STAS domain-containing protein [Streptomyces sp. G-G2]